MVEVSELLLSRRWEHRVWPFPHFFAKNVFHESVYRKQANAFQQILDRGLMEVPDEGHFSRSVSGYDVFAFNFHKNLPGFLDIFLSREWHDTISRATGVVATGDVKGGFHHHAIGSASGTVHNDLNPGWFIGTASPDGINLSNNRRCNYHTGKTMEALGAARETVRGTAMIFYLNNPEWRVGDGGETGLYRGSRLPVETPCRRVPPINNSMLLFECTPYSYHAFLSNRHAPRNSVIMWTHRPKDNVLSRWGERSIVKWR